ncbi:MAG: Gfo/Idh/MocA family oxidoreductase [Acidobacteria bacterium]|nr:Gfo/Idh/MocA family oxidoreductase [Acidobacteriota bacterium]
MSTRRQFLSAAIVSGFPSIVPSRVLGQTAPSNRIQVAQIGCGRIARGSEIAGVLRNSAEAQYVAVCDLDTVRLADAKQLIESAYEKKYGGKYSRLKSCGDYREMLEDKSIDAVCISTPDHWHAQPAMEASLAGKDVYLQKPASLTIREGRQMADVVKKSGRILQLGSQQRSDPQFRYACELVRNGRIGALRQVFIGLPVDPAGDEESKMPVPSNLNYDMWLGSTPEVYYTEKRVHPQASAPRVRYDRPGWLRCEQFGAGMITGWGAHHIDIAHWAMNLEESGPIEVSANAEFPKKGLWDVHGPYHVMARYANGVTMFISEKYPNGVRFIGDNGWIWVTRGKYTPGVRDNTLNASDPRILSGGIGANETHLHESPGNDHHLDWLMSIRTRQAPAAPVEAGHRSCSACLLAWAAMRLGRTLRWDPAIERFVNDDEANATLSRTQRAPYGTDAVLAKHAEIS